MKINPDKCVACGNCTYVCPMGAIYIDPSIKRATINDDECVECYACFNGLSQEHMNPTLVRTMRKVFQMMRLRFDPEPDVCPTAAMRPDIMNEKVMSAILEIKVPVSRTEEVIRMVWDVEKRIDTVVALGVGTRCDEAGDETIVAPILERLGYKLERAKTNIGLGRITNEAAAAPMEMVKS